MLLHKCRNVAPRHGWVVLGAYGFAWLLCQQMGDNVHGVGLAMSVCPSPGHYRMYTLLNPTGRFGFGKPNRLEYFSHVTRLDFM